MEEKKRQEGYAHIIKYTGLFGGVQGLNILVALVRNKLVALLLGPTGVGLLSLFNSTIRFMSDSTNLGLGMSSVKHISEAFAKGDQHAVSQSISTIRAWSLITGCAGMLLCAALSPLLSKYTFGWGQHTLHFLLLSPVVGMTAVTSGEAAILKGTRRLAGLARISVYNVLAALVLSVPLFVWWGDKAIVLSIFLVAFAQMVVTIAYSFSLYPPRLKVNTKVLGRGKNMIRLGIAFLFAGMFGSGADFVIRSYLNNTGSPNMLGLFNAGYMIVMTYAGMVFSAMETDYFPRLSAISHVGPQLNDTVNKQIEVSLIIIAPMLVALVIGLPVIIPLLYSKAFTPVVPMAQTAALALYLRAVKLPVAYLPLARGDSSSYLLMESLYDVVLVLLSVVCYNIWGLSGMGWAILFTALFDFILLTTYMHYHYSYKLSAGVIRVALCQMPLGVAAYALTWCSHGWGYWLLGTALGIVSLAFSIFELHQRTHLWQTLKNKIAMRKD